MEEELLPKGTTRPEGKQLWCHGKDTGSEPGGWTSVYSFVKWDIPVILGEINRDFTHESALWNIKCSVLYILIIVTYVLYIYAIDPQPPWGKQRSYSFSLLNLKLFCIWWSSHSLYSLVLACGRRWGWSITSQVCWYFALVRIWWHQVTSRISDFSSILICWLSPLQGPSKAWVAAPICLMWSTSHWDEALRRCQGRHCYHGKALMWSHHWRLDWI